MVVVTQRAEIKLLELVTSLKEFAGGYYAIHYHLSDLQDQYRSDYQVRIAVNILKDLFKGLEYSVFVCQDSDVFLIYRGYDRSLLEKAIFQVRYLFMDDPLAYSTDGFENEEFCSVYDLEFRWRDFFIACKSNVREEASDSRLVIEPESLVKKEAPAGSTVPEQSQYAKQQLFSPSHLAQMAIALKTLDVSSAVRSQTICAAIKGKPIKPLYQEMFVNISHLCKLLKLEVDLLSSHPLFRYLTELLDQRVLFLMRDQFSTYFHAPLSINLNIKTLLSEEFAAFDAMIKPKYKPFIIIEVHVADVFEDVATFVRARNIVKRLGYRVCLDGLDSVSILQIDRETLGCDLLKLRWNPDMAGEHHEEKNKKLSQAIIKTKPSRVILCRCDDQKAVNFGHSVGISLFQGRHFDKILFPESAVVN
jgi:hypothetical protein